MTRLARVDVLPPGITAYDEFSPIQLPQASGLPRPDLWASMQRTSSINGGTFSDGDAILAWLDSVGGKSWAKFASTAAPTVNNDGFNGKRMANFAGGQVLVNTDGNVFAGDGTNPRTFIWVVNFSGVYTSNFAYLGAFEVDGTGDDVLYGFSSSAGYNYFNFGGKAAGGKYPMINAPNSWPQGAGFFIIALTYDGSNTLAGMKLYDRGVSKAIQAGSDDSDTTTTNILGSWITSGTFSFQGGVGEQIVFNRVLSSSDLAAWVNFLKTDPVFGYFNRDGGTTPIIGPGGGNLATGATPILTNPRVSQTALLNDPAGLLLRGTDLFITYYQENNGAPRMEKWNVSNRAAPTKTDTLAAIGSVAPFSITKGQGNYAFVPLYKGSQVAVMDLSKALSTGAVQVATINTAGSPQYCWTWGNYLALACGNSVNPQWQLIHVADPTKPSAIFTGTLQGHDSPSSAIAVSNDGYIYFAAAGNVHNAFIGVFNANDLSNISQTGSYTFPGGDGTTFAESVYLELVGNRLYMADYFESKVWVWDISTRNSPSLLYTFTVPTNPVQIEVAGNYAYVLSNGGNCIDVWDISSNSSATHLGTINTSATTGPQAMYLDAANGYIYVVLAGTQGPEGTFAVNYLEIYNLN